MNSDWLWVLYILLPWLLPLLVLAVVLVGGAALGTVIVAAVGAVRTGLVRREPAENVDVAEFFAAERSR